MMMPKMMKLIGMARTVRRRRVIGSRSRRTSIRRVFRSWPGNRARKGEMKLDGILGSKSNWDNSQAREANDWN
jgi:hypothetical protein